MQISSSRPARLTLCLASLLFFGAVNSPMQAQDKKKAPSAPAKSAPAPKPASAPRPAGGGASTAAHTGPTTTTHTGPTTSGPTTGGATTAGKGPTTSNPGGAAKTTTTTTNPGGTKTTNTTTTGTRPATPGSTGTAAARTPGATAPGSRAGGAPGPGAKASPISHPAPAGSHEVKATNGTVVRTRPNGTRSDVHDEKRGMDVHHGLNGERRVSVERADHSRVFAERGGHGYVQHPYMYRGHEYGHRTYYYNGRYYDRYYGRSYYRGAYLDVYAPSYYYAPGFYGWAYNPWSAPISYSWGFAANPWYGYYGAAYFTPYPVYPSAAFWLTDYLISQSLAAAYQAQVEANQTAALQGAAPLTPEIKKMVSDEVQRQVALENAEAAQNAQKTDVDATGSSIARLLSDNQPHVFIAGSNLDLVDTSGAECAVSQGDVLEVASAPSTDATAATALVLTTKGGKECHKGTNVQVAFTDLQDMQNHMRETVDAGLSDLQKKQGQGGLPQAPPSAQAAPVQSVVAAAGPPPDKDAATEIKQETQEADKAEAEAGAAVAASGPSDSPAPSPAPAAPVQSTTISLGQTVADVTASLGQPKTVLNKGAVQIYVYPDMKITFKGGKVSDIQ